MAEFIKTDIDIAFDIEKGFTAADVADMTIRLERGQFSLTKKLGSGITELDGAFILSISNTEITNPGDYQIYARLTDQNGKKRGIDVSPGKIVFEDFPIAR